MTLTKGRIDRAGKIHFGDASLHIWEEGIPREWDAARAWERVFHRQVFHRIVQTLKRLGWTVGPGVYIWTDSNARHCRKGDLQADLLQQGRSIEFKMFQAVNCPKRPDHDGRHEWNKEPLMPYTMRLEMERTRRRIRDYLVNVFTGYAFKADRDRIHFKPLALTSMQRLQLYYLESSHFKGDLTKYKISDYNNKGAGGEVIEHGQRVWFRDERTGRAATGIAFYNINNMWWVVTGLYDLRNEAASRLHTRPLENPRGRHFPDRRRKRLEQELSRAVKAMDFDRAKVIKNVLFPPGTGPLFHVRVKADGLLWGPNRSGYTHDSVHAGKYTQAEAERIVRGADDRLEAVEAAA